MNVAAEYRTVDALAAHLPFALDDYDAVNRLTVQWREDGHALKKRNLDVWTYCYVRRFFLVRWSRESGRPISDFDDLVTTAFQKVQAKRDTVSDPNRYSQWVLVVCRNTFLNYLERKRLLVPVADCPEPAQLDDELEPATYEFVTEAVEEAIERLPESLQEMSRLHLIQKRSYEDIARTLGRPESVVRTYVWRALAKLRYDKRLCERLEWMKEQATPS